MIDAEYWKKIAENWAVENDGTIIEIVPEPIKDIDLDTEDEELDEILADLGLD